MRVRVILADDHAVIRTGLRAVIEADPRIEVVAEVGSGSELVEVARELRPEIVVTDITMPGMNGIEAAKHIAAELPETKVIFLSMHVDRRFVTAALAAGAAGYLAKSCCVEELVRAIEVVESGKTYLSPDVANIVVAELRSPADLKDPSSPFELLTTREREVLQLIAEGHGTKTIGDKLGVSAKTVGTFRSHLFEKLGVQSVAELTKYAIREGLTSVE